MKNIAVLGSTGSIGRQTLEIVSALGPGFRVVALAADSNDRLLAEQVKRFKPEIAALNNVEAAGRLSEEVRSETCRVEGGPDGQLAAATWPSADLIVMAQVGFSGFKPLIAALSEGKTIALANKESLVAGGEILERLGMFGQNQILPVDSEHSAIWQCLGSSTTTTGVRRIYLTASGGPFYGWKTAKLAKVTPGMALKHPTWQMGAKITVDSATMMNKGLEVIEAKWLFSLNLEQIEVIIHRQSIIHSMVEYIDGSIIAQLGQPDMQLPIQYALTYPERKEGPTEKFNPFGRTLSFEEPDRKNFPCLDLAVQASRSGGTMPAVLNGANEIAVEGFLSGLIGFMQIPQVIEQVMQLHDAVKCPGIEDIIEADNWSRREAADIIDGLTGRVT